MHELEQAGHEPAAFPIGPVDFAPNQNVEPALRRGYDDFDWMSHSIRLYHQFSLMERTGNGIHIGFPIFEGNKFTKQERLHLSSCDYIFVCSEWAKEVLINEKIYPIADENGISVIPLGVDLSIFKPSTKEEREILKDDKESYKFFFPGKFEYRKGFDIVMRVFEQVFSPADNIEIYFLPFNPFIREQNDEWAKFLLSSPLAPKIKILNRMDSHETVANLYRIVDCVVSFSRAEGWNLPLLEGLACGCQCVATNYSGQTEFLTADNAVLIDIPDREPMIDGVFFDGKSGSEWLSLENSINKMAEGLMEVYKRGKVVNNKGIETAERFTWQKTAEKILLALN